MSRKKFDDLTEALRALTSRWGTAFYCDACLNCEYRSLGLEATGYIVRDGLTARCDYCGSDSVPPFTSYRHGVGLLVDLAPSWSQSDVEITAVFTGITHRGGKDVHVFRSVLPTSQPNGCFTFQRA